MPKHFSIEDEDHQFIANDGLISTQTTVSVVNLFCDGSIHAILNVDLLGILGDDKLKSDSKIEIKIWSDMTVGDLKQMIAGLFASYLSDYLLENYTSQGFNLK